MFSRITAAQLKLIGWPKYYCKSPPKLPIPPKPPTTPKPPTPPLPPTKPPITPTTPRTSVNKLNDIYKKAFEIFKSKPLPLDVKAHGVFACNDLDLREVEVYGFDYDYTIANYKPELHYLLYNIGRSNLIKNLDYPKAIEKFEYDPHFAVRGLHYDISKGLLLKLDSYLQVQLGSVYRGRKLVSDEEVLRIYKTRSLPISYVEGDKSGLGSNMVLLADLFSVPAMCLLSNVADYFEKHNIDYYPEILFNDVKVSIGGAHPVMHALVEREGEKYIIRNPRLRVYLEKLMEAKKQIFIVTNSPYKFVDKGMGLLVGPDWKKFFDVIIVQSRKPNFFTDESRPLRLLDEHTGFHLWDRVTRLERGKIYYEGTVKQLQDLTGWHGQKVLYFGDHPFSDLADVTLMQGWRTGAIISELTHEIHTLNNPTYKASLTWLYILTQLIEDHQNDELPGSREELRRWDKERDKLRMIVKSGFNQQFGSVFRTFINPTYFSRRLFRFADIYTSDLTNLNHFSINHVFYPRRGVMPHEYISSFI